MNLDEQKISDFTGLKARKTQCPLVGLTVQCERGGAGHRPATVGGHAGVRALILRIHLGDVQLAAVLKLRHPEEL